MLRAKGAKVQTNREAGLRGHADQDQLAYARKNGSVLVTCDRDFLDERRYPLIHCPAIFVFDFGSGSLEEMNQAFTLSSAPLSSMTNGARLMPNVTAGLSFSATLTERHPEQDFGSGEVRCKSAWIEIGARFDESGSNATGDCMPTHGYEPMRCIRSGCCAHAVSGRAAAPPSSVMNSRHLTRSPRRHAVGILG